MIMAKKSRISSTMAVLALAMILISLIGVEAQDAVDTKSYCKFSPEHTVCKLYVRFLALETS